MSRRNYVIYICSVVVLGLLAFRACNTAHAFKAAMPDLVRQTFDQSFEEARLESLETNATLMEGFLENLGRDVGFWNSVAVIYREVSVMGRVTSRVQNRLNNLGEDPMVTLRGWSIARTINHYFPDYTSYSITAISPATIGIDVEIDEDVFDFYINRGY